MIKLLLVFLFFPLFLSAQTDSLQKGIKWTTGLSWEQIKQKAKEESKFIFVDAYATWCVPCKKMDSVVYPDKAVGEVVNPRFISVKIQMDETPKDNEPIKAWYGVARNLSEQYKPEGYPCFLFFSPEGKLVHRGLGLQTPNSFIVMGKEALTNPIGEYDSNVKKFESGGLPFTSMPALARMAIKKRNKDLYIRVAKEYKEKYLDQLDTDAAFNKDNLLFVAEYSDYFLTTKDRFFRFFYEHGDKADQIMDRKDKLSQKIVLSTISKTEIKDKIYNNGQPIVNPKPDWEALKNSILEKYGSVYVAKLFPDEQISYCQASKDWRNYVKYINKKIKENPLRKDSYYLGSLFGDGWALNGYTWHLFEGCQERAILKKGLAWINMSIDFDPKYHPYLDTKANLLYRIGKVKEAIELEKKAISLAAEDSSLFKKYLEILEKMKIGEPTWPIK